MHPPASAADFNAWNITVAGIVYDGRSGSVFLQSLFDGHSQILTTPATILTTLPHFWDEFGHLNLDGLLENFSTRYASLFDSREDSSACRLNELGEGKNETLRINADEFRSNMRTLLSTGPLTRKRFFLAVHYAYGLCIGQDLMKVKVLLFPLHMPDRPAFLRKFMDDFPDSKIILIVRDPRASHAALFRAHVTKGRMLLGDRVLIENLWRLPLEVYVHALKGPEVLEKGVPRPNIRAVRLEDVHTNSEPTLRALAAWLGIEWQPALLESTIGGKKWWGDVTMASYVNGFSKHIFNDKWKKEFGWADLMCLEFFWDKRIRDYGYALNVKEWTGLKKAVLMFLIFIPTRWELAALKDYFNLKAYHGLGDSIRALRGMARLIGRIPKRWLLFYGSYFEALRNRGVTFQKI